MSAPTPDQVEKFLRTRGTPGTGAFGVQGFRIENRFYTREQALKLAELAMLAGTGLTDAVSSELVLNMARRIAALEDRLAEYERAVQNKSKRFGW